MAVVVEAATVEPVAAPSLPPAGGKRLGGEQLAVAAGQMTAGAGNLAFSLVAARLLDPSGFAHLSVFLGLYLVLSLPATSLSAATALDPGQRNVLLRRVGWASVALAVAAGAASPFLAPALGLPVPMVLVLAAVLPVTAPLALDRGRLYGTRRHLTLVGSLLSEPATRLTAGVAMAAGLGAVGAAGGVVLGAYAAREVARSGIWRQVRRSPGPRRVIRLDPARPAGQPRPADQPRPGDQPATRSTPGPDRSTTNTAAWTAVAFALLAVVQNQDLVFANAMLPGPRAGTYAALSTVGGAAAFATVTVPLVLLPRAVRGEKHSLGVAVGLATLLGGGAVALGAVSPGRIATAFFGHRYGTISHLIIPYLAAMGLLGVTRVLVAHRCGTGAPRAVTVLVAAAAAGQAATLAVVGHSVTAIAFSTVGTTAALTLVLLAERGARRLLGGVDLKDRARRALSDPVVRAVVVVLVAGLAIRLVTFRGIWLDEATSIHQAGMSFGGMIRNLRNTDVHPPLYFTVLWATVRAFGNGTMAVRIPSILAGTLVIPAAYVTARDIWDRRSGVVAAVLASVGPILVWYSQEIRMYSMFMLFALLAVWGQIRVLRRGRGSDWTVYVLASAALFWTEYFGCFQIIAQQAFFVAVLWRDRRGRGQRPSLLRGWLVSTGVLVLTVLPLVPFVWHQFLINQAAGKGFGAPSQTPLAGEQGLSIYTVLANVTWALVGYHSAGVMAAVVALWPLGILLSVFLLGRNMTRPTLVVVVAAVVPLLMLVGAGVAKRFLFDVRYVSGVCVALLLLTSRLVTGATRSRRMVVAGCVAVTAVFGASLVDEQINGSNPRLYDFAGALRAVSRHTQPGDQLTYAPADIGLVLQYYRPKAPMYAMDGRLPTAPAGHTVFVLASKDLMNGEQPAELGRLLARLRRVDRPAGVIKKPNVEVWMFVVPPTTGLPAHTGPIPAEVTR